MGSAGDKIPWFFFQGFCLAIKKLIKGRKDRVEKRGMKTVQIVKNYS